MVYLTLKGGTELKAFNTKEERQQWCENNNILMFSRETPVFKKHEHKIKENFPFMFEKSSI